MTIVITAGATDTQRPMVLYENVFSDGVLVASSAIADGAGDNAVDTFTYDYWTPAIVPAQLTVTLDGPTEVDCFGIAAHNLGSEGATVSLQYYNGSTWVTIVSQSPLLDADILAVFPTVTATQFRVNMSGAVASIGVVMAGKRLVFPTGILSGYTSTDHSKKYDLMTTRTLGGNFAGNRVYRVGIETSVTFGMIDADWVDTTMALFENHYNTGQPFFYAGSPSTLPNDMCYAWRPERGGELSPSYEEGGIYQEFDMDIMAYAR